MFGKKKCNEAVNISLEDILYLQLMIADKLGIDTDGIEKAEEIEENAVVDTEKFFEEEKAEGDHDDSIKNEEHTDKRKLIDEIGGMLKGKVDEEVWRTIIGKAEELAYTGSEDNEKVNEIEDKEEIEEEQKETGLKELEKKENSIKKPVMEITKSLISNSINNSYKSRDERIAETNKRFYL